MSFAIVASFTSTTWITSPLDIYAGVFRVLLLTVPCRKSFTAGVRVDQKAKPNTCPSQSVGRVLDLPFSGTPHSTTGASSTVQFHNGGGMSKSAAAYAQAQDLTVAMPPKQVPKLPIITIVPDANPVGRRGPAAAAARQQVLNSSRSSWSANFYDCCCSVAPTYCCIVTCCPCTTIASVEEGLGGGYERTLLYFGGLALGFLVSVGFATSNNSDEPVDHRVGPVVGSTSPPPTHRVSSGLIMWEAFAAMFLMTFLFGVWRLRMQTRHSLGIQGSHFYDCFSSFFCCFCVISQLHLELKCHYNEPRAQHGRRGHLASTCPVDTLAPYAVM